MNESLLAGYESLLRLGCFAGIFAVMALWEGKAPRRAPSVPRNDRWLGNLTIVAVNAILVRLLFPAAALGMAWAAEARGWGLLNQFPAPRWISFTLAIVLLDLVIYFQHVLFHAVPALWRLHRVHHADIDFDVTTGSRFHPLEIILSMIVKLGTVAALGPPVLAVLAFEILLNATAMFNHSNVRIPRNAERMLRLFLVTPDMHRVHHSTSTVETNSNFGFNLPWWDRLLGTYRAQPALGHEAMAIGVRDLQDGRSSSLAWMILSSFRGGLGPYSFSHRRKRTAEAS